MVTIEIHEQDHARECQPMVWFTNEHLLMDRERVHSKVKAPMIVCISDSFHEQAQSQGICFIKMSELQYSSIEIGGSSWQWKSVSY